MLSIKLSIKKLSIKKPIGKRFLAGIASVATVVVATGIAGAEPRLSPRLTQQQVENELSLWEIRKNGLRIYTTPFNLEDGLGDGPIDPQNTVDPGGRPTLLNNGIFLRMNGLDSQTCLECHNYRSNATVPAEFAIGGVGGVGESAFPGLIDPDIDDSDNNGFANSSGRMINPPFSYGSGGVEAVGKEMTKALQALKAQAQANPNTVVPLVAKGVDFGSISHDGVDFDLANVEGIDDDLVIKPFGRTGCCSTVRDFDTGAMQFHHGIQPVEVVGEGVDADGDGVVNELLEGELSAIHIYQATLESPRGYPLRAESRRGAEHFEDAGCASCHRPVMTTDSRFLTLSLPEIPEDPDANVYFQINLNRRAPGFRMSGSGVAVPMFADLKLHDMGAGLVEGDGNTVFTTARLWGVADTAPYMHDGRAPTIRGAIELHGGEGQGAADAFAALDETEKEELLSFLGTLRAPRYPNFALIDNRWPF